MNTIKLKTAIGMWTINFQDESEITTIVDVYVPKKQYDRFLNRAKRHPLSVFTTMFIDGNELISKRSFDVGLVKIQSRWLVNKDKFLIAINKKREIHRGGIVEKHFERLLSELGV